uniref:Uncharacterized protein n=1 Tax=Sphaerodactylus townsendi TaxID=933632 RepID=A0ACB8FAX0_9SAUR
MTPTDRLLMEGEVSLFLSAISPVMGNSSSCIALEAAVSRRMRQDHHSSLLYQQHIHTIQSNCIYSVLATLILTLHTTCLVESIRFPEGETVHIFFWGGEGEVR